ncbi:hypothetical protein ACHWQZ_G009148 [Mnemiopsis leidyi]
MAGTQNFNVSADYTIGVILCIVSFLGVTFNVISFFYFSTLETRNSTAKFFKRLYMVITCNDFLICAALFANIDAAFARERKGLLLFHPTLCTVWVFVMWVLPQMSIFLVGLLSLSRLFVLRYPTKKLNPELAWVLPLTCLIVILSLSGSLRLSDVMYPNYFPEWFSCAPSCFPADSNFQDQVSQKQVNNGMIIAIPYNVIPALSIIPISVSFILSLLSLYKSNTVAVTLNSSSRRQREAAVTVIIVTSLYILFNIPYAAFLTFILTKLSEPLPDQGITLENYIKTRITQSTNNSSVDNYLAAVVYIVNPSLNSMINPAVYFWRIQSFHSSVMSLHVCKRTKKVTPQQSNHTVTRETVA